MHVSVCMVQKKLTRSGWAVCVFVWIHEKNVEMFFLKMLSLVWIDKHTSTYTNSLQVHLRFGFSLKLIMLKDLIIYMFSSIPSLPQESVLRKSNRTSILGAVLSNVWVCVCACALQDHMTWQTNYLEAVNGTRNGSEMRYAKWNFESRPQNSWKIYYIWRSISTQADGFYFTDILSKSVNQGNVYAFVYNILYQFIYTNIIHQYYTPVRAVQSPCIILLHNNFINSNFYITLCL